MIMHQCICNYLALQGDCERPSISVLLRAASTANSLDSWSFRPNQRAKLSNITACNEYIARYLLLSLARSRSSVVRTRRSRLARRWCCAPVGSATIRAGHTVGETACRGSELGRDTWVRVDAAIVIGTDVAGTAPGTGR